MLFNLSSFSPITFFFGIAWWIQNKTNEFSIVAGKIHFSEKAIIISIIGFLGLLYAFCSVIILKISRKKLECVPISAESVKSKDSFSIVAIITYVLPFSYLVFDDLKIWYALSIIGVAVIFLILINTVWSNPILILCGYHFYEISNANGSEELPMISKRKSIQDAKTIKKVITLWDYFMIEVK